MCQRGLGKDRRVADARQKEQHMQRQEEACVFGVEHRRAPCRMTHGEVAIKKFTWEGSGGPHLVRHWSFGFWIVGNSV